ncbi:MAG TPA: twin-arginine translocase TatA/TatE family subunit [Chloroflexota bacterium]
MGLGALQPGHLIVILAIVLLIFGPRKLGDLGKALGGGLKEFRKGVDVGDSSRPESALSTRSCPNCRAAVPQHDKFCGVCGHAMTAPSGTV